MPVTLNATPDHGFNQPLGLLQDCHRRVEKFLGVLQRIAHENRGQTLDNQRREALEASLRYFRNAAPWHTQDEEISLFPRLRARGGEEAAAAFDRLAALERDHDVAEPLHREVDSLGRLWLQAGCLAPAHADRLSLLTDTLAAMYREHIAMEEQCIFPLAARVLSPDAVRAMGREMAERRGVDPGFPPRRCRHGRAALAPSPL